MLTINAMVRIGPWIVTTIEHLDKQTNCERCSTSILEVWVCEVDADSPRLGELGGKSLWRIGSTCGPTLMQVSDERWKSETSLATKRLRLLKRVDRLQAVALAREHTLPEFVVGRRQSLIDGTLEDRRFRHLGLVVSTHERRLGLKK
jgi:hypothetical protein